MPRELSPQEEAFRERFIYEKDSLEPDEVPDEEIEAYRTVRRARFFWGSMAVLMVLPFLFTGVLFYGLARYEELAGPGVLTLLQDLSSSEADAMATSTGMDGLVFASQVYDARFLIAAAIFTFFFGLVALIILGRIILQTLARRRA